MMMALVVMWFAAEPNLQFQIDTDWDWDGVILVASVLVIGLVAVTVWAVVRIWMGGASAERVVAALFLAPVVAISSGVGWYFVMFDLIVPLVPFQSRWVQWGNLLWFGFLVMPVVAVGGFIWLFRRIGGKPSEGQGSAGAEPDV